MLRHDFDEIIDRTNTVSSKWDKYPADVLPLWVADTDFRSPRPVIDALAKRVAHGAFGYTWENGSFERSTQSWVGRRYGWNIEPGWVLFCPSVVTALGLMVRTLSAPGDNVLIQPPVYPPFFSITSNNGRVPLENPLVYSDGGWRIDFDDLEAKLAAPRTSLFILCNPHNPTGRGFTEEELRRMGELCLKHDVRVFSDEIHSDFVFSGRHIPFPSLSPELAGISASCVSPSKTFNLADLRTSGLVIPDAVMRGKIAKESEAARLERCSLGILAYDTAYSDCDYYADQVRDYLCKNLDHAVRYISENIPGLAAYKPEATFLLWLDCRGLGLAQPELEAFFLEKAKVALNSGVDFGSMGRGFMRMNVACPRATLDEALRRIERAVPR